MAMWVIRGLVFHCLREIRLDLKKIRTQARILIIKMQVIIKNGGTPLII